MKFKDEAILGTVLVLGIGFVFLFLWGLFIYNHTQDVNRDKYLIDHCKSVTIDKPVTNSQVFMCGVQK